MSANGKQILITTESHEVFVIRQSNGYPISGRCPSCGRIETEPLESSDDLEERVLSVLQRPADEEDERKY